MSSRHPLAQTDIATAVLNEAGPLTAFLLALDLGYHLAYMEAFGVFPLVTNHPFSNAFSVISL